MLKKLMVHLMVLSVIFFGVVGCGTGSNTENNSGEEPKGSVATKLVDDFEVSINVDDRENDPIVYATITYLGEDAETDIYHGGSIFFFNIYQIDGDFEYMGAMDLPLITTSLKRNEPHNVQLMDKSLKALETGTYEFEAIADFSLDIDDMVNTRMKIEVSTIHEIGGK
ncbi:hypothetical protein H1D32_02560 [Anaerobacillus sp. CMMVII]|uniref:hypothetical protein n=1 Tax=Anaerobacillus sp. CMMVII TaxID=2755588 RepID=UPI0021B80CB2|nr:hypothetical protein [Anaerobacillus sp. CMMVII]MCT8136730.1 hypothetical protein [Anaerobacillus sp. CMMVII]